MTNCSTLADAHNGDPLLRFSNYYTFPSSFLGVLCNAVALWCVVGCPKTRTAVKVLLCALFSTILLQCLLAKFLKVYTLWWCDDMAVSYVHVGIILLILLAGVEHWYIFIITFFRTVAKRHGVKIQTSVGLVVGVFFLSIAIPLIKDDQKGMQLWGDKGLFFPSPIFQVSFVNDITMISLGEVTLDIEFLLPVFLTLACYVSLIFVARRNKRRLAATQDMAATGQVMDQDTRAMLAVFITILVLVMPLVTRLYLELLNVSNESFNVTTKILLQTHWSVAPVVFVCFNNHHRQRVLQAVKSCLQWVSRCPPCTRPHTTNTPP